MLQFIIGIVVGLLIGWNLFKQPNWVKNIIEKIKIKISG